jgi:hypothetical protein
MQNAALNGSVIVSKRGQSNDKIISVAALTSGSLPYDNQHIISVIAAPIEKPFTAQQNKPNHSSTPSGIYSQN